MNFKLEQYVFPKTVLLRPLIKTNPTVKAKAISKIVSKEASGEEYWTYSVTEKNEISLTLYKPDDVESVTTKEKSLLPITEYLKMFAFIHSEGTQSVFVIVEQRLIAVIDNESVTRYLKITGDKEALIEEVHSIEKSLALSNKKYKLYFNEGLDCFSGEPFDLLDEDVQEAIKPTQIIKNTNRVKGSATGSSSLLVASVALGSALLISGAVVGSTYFQSQALSEVKDDIKKLQRDVKAYSLSTVPLTKNKEEEKVAGYMRVHPDDFKSIRNIIDSQITSIEKSFTDKTKELAIAGLFSGGLEKADAPKKEFLCKPVMLTADTLACQRAGRTHNLTSSWTKIDGFTVRYNPKTKEIQVRDSRGGFTSTTVEQARGVSR